MTHVMKSGLVLAFAIGCMASALAQSAPTGYRSLDEPETTVATSQEAANPSAPNTYVAERGTSLRTTLEQWSKKAGWQPISWKLPEDLDFTLGAQGVFNGDFVTATRAFINSLGTEAELHVQFNQGNRLLVVGPQK